MVFVTALIDFILHIDTHIASIIQQFGIFTYLIVFFIILGETGLVIAPILPGDSLLFVLGTFAAQDVLNLGILFILLSLAAIAGDSLNYWVGSFFGEKVLVKSRFVKQEHIERTKEFYRKHGGKTIIIARFMPIVRTFAPFVAGVGKMEYARFFMFNVVGGIAWVGLFLFGGYFFGGIPFVQKNLSVFIILIVATSFMPVIIEYVRKKLKNSRKFKPVNDLSANSLKIT